MSKKEARKITIIEELLEGRLLNRQASELLDLSVRQVQRLKSEAAANGVMSTVHKRRGHRPSNALEPERVSAIVQICRKELAGYNFTHTTEVLAEEKNIFVSVSTVSRYLKAAGISSPKAKRRPKRHRCRNAREHEGELAQMDASSFDWLSDGSYLNLHGAVDDATGRILALHFKKEETFDGYCELMFQMNQDGHLPREIYTDGRTVFVYDCKKKRQLTIEEELEGKYESQPQFARALRQINILLIIAKSAQAKGCIERLWETLQDRLVKDMKREEITSVEQANAFLKRYIPYYNRKFAVQASSPIKAYLPKQDTYEMERIFAVHETRILDSGLSFSFKGRKYCLPVFAGNKKIPVSPRDTLTVATGKRIGIQVLFKGFVMDPIPLLPKPKASILHFEPLNNPTPQVKIAPLTQSRSPWFKYNNFVFSHNKKGSNLHKGGDILPDQLSPSRGDIFADH